MNILDQQRYKVLIAEDEPFQLSLLEEIVTGEGYIVCKTVKSGLKLIEETKIHQPDILLLDIGLQKLDGISAVKQIIADGSNPLLQLIFTTGSVDTKHLLAGFELDTIDYITKPYDPERLKRALAKAKAQIHMNKIVKSYSTVEKHMIQLVVDHQVRMIDENQIVYVERNKSSRTKSLVHLSSGQVVETSSNLKEIKEKSTDAIIFSHRSFLINLNYIQMICTNEFSRSTKKALQINLLDVEEDIPLTRKNYNLALDQLSKFI